MQPFVAKQWWAALGQGCNDPNGSRNNLRSKCLLQGTVCNFGFSTDSQTFVLIYILWETKVRETMEIHKAHPNTF